MNLKIRTQNRRGRQKCLHSLRMLEMELNGTCVTESRSAVAWEIQKYLEIHENMTY